MVPSVVLFFTKSMVYFSENLGALHSSMEILISGLDVLDLFKFKCNLTFIVYKILKKLVTFSITPEGRDSGNNFCHF